LPNALLTAYALAAALLLCAIGRRVFNRYKHAFADYA
jgi:ABC-type polysaccharide/polyol phosphate export permease